MTLEEAIMDLANACKAALEVIDESLQFIKEKTEDEDKPFEPTFGEKDRKEY